MMSVTTPTKKELIQDLRELLEIHRHVTRDLYREKGFYAESSYKELFGNWRTFHDAATGSGTQSGTKSVQSNESVKQELTDDKWDFTLVSRIKSLDELVKQFEVDLSVWAVERFVANSWEMGYKDQEGNAKTQPLYQVKATFVKNKNVEAAIQEIADLKAQYKKSAHWPKRVLKPTGQYGNCLELLIPDLHAGKFAWSKETGGADYDTPTAIATFERAVDSIIAGSFGYKFDEIVLGVGNDALNSDDYNSQTTKGTLVNSDTRYQKTYKAVREMYCRTIERLRQHCKKVVVKVIPGNHDTQSTFTLGDSLECYFHNYDDVEIDNSPSPHKFYRWGNVFLGLTHGDKGKKADYGIWMATERPKDFGETLFREIHIGHTHGLKVDEKFGIRVRTFASLGPADAWHSGNMFVGNLRQAEGIVWNKERGRVAEFVYTEIDEK
jgi:hypothetical protein